MSAPWANGGCVHVGVSSTSHVSKNAAQSRTTPWRSTNSIDHVGGVDRRVLDGGEVEEGPAVRRPSRRRAAAARPGCRASSSWPTARWRARTSAARPRRRRGRHRPGRRPLRRTAGATPASVVAAGRLGAARRPGTGRPARRRGGSPAGSAGHGGAGPATASSPAREVGDVARHDALDRHQLERDRRVLRWQTTRRAARRRVVGLIEAIPQQWAGLRSDPPRSLPSPSGDIPLAMRAGLAAARPAGRDVGAPRVAGQPAQRRVGVHAQPEVGQVRAGERDRAGGPHALDDRGVDRDDGIGEGRHTLGRRPAGDVDVLLDA